MAPLSTYRLQMRGDAFTFADAQDLLDYYAALGVSHLYLSPILTAAEGSTHGYDVTDPTEISPELGGRDGFEQLSRAARAKGLGLIVDIVPNHVGVEKPRENPWWWDVLKHGRGSSYASYFDIDWDLDGGRVVLPVLGSDSDADDLVVDDSGAEPVLRLGDLVYPIAPGTADGTGPQVHDRQHYHLIGWRNGICGYRRFFSITSLAGLRQEDRAVFDATHVEVKRWFTEGLVDGVRIDHPDGLSDPAGYLGWLREITGPDAWIVIEKILAADEPLDLDLPVEGTTGYDAMREIGGVFIDPTGERALTELFESTGVSYRAVGESAQTLKAQAMTETLGSELARLRRTVVAAAGTDHDDLPPAIAALLSRVGVYRSDYPSLSGVLPAAIAETASQEPDLAPALAVLSSALARGPETGVRLQQLCGASTAKSMEDCLFYRDARLVSLNEVGSEPHHFGVSVAELHHRAAVRAQLWPHAMVSLSTHDTKRGEDVRARIGVLSQVPSLWAELIGKWTPAAPPPDAGTGLFLWQNIFGVWPVDGEISDDLRGRLHAYAEKAIREAGTHTSWNDPDTAFETGVHEWVDAVLDGPVAAEMTSLVARLDLHARSDALGQKLMALTAPGVPDVYQGTELWEDSLVDPDNRRPVDYSARRDALAARRHPKLRVVSAALALRRDRPAVFADGGYLPVLADGQAADHVVAFLRGGEVLTAVTRHSVRLSETGWGDTSITLPAGAWTDRISGRAHRGTVPVAELFTELPVTLLERADD
ncbi:malto-oligosyltrehalose synthase [Mycolicibacterium flavescens]|uniref:Malto-oligosyltrehalose synthase n=1 Tax=Mycolicibacterium flavescens TaxID=1776 RepID=A0A1E3RPZ8_MYCFV|nr:malto-oligosyltrehalose synthase [Mycolicibacterium flavescens]MCV7279431.1 malto-oligosyltrehalose synthase [Mycolicibacterium flavescens]ODQ91963.1 malto-oligosyltrehalose synthase [Mycolicibacterium flavescens]